MAYIDPVFAQYNPNLARAMTTWLYADPANPTHKDESQWPQTGAVQIVNRVLTFLAVPVGVPAAPVPATLRLDITGGLNCIVFSRAATISPTGAPALTVLPNEQSSNVNCLMTRTDGFIEVDNQPISLAWGTVPGMPYTPPAPWFWYANSARVLTVQNNSGVVQDINLGFSIALLDTGR